MTMIASMKPLATFLHLKEINIYDSIFILHSKCTMIILLTFALLLSAKQYFGDPIQCMTDLKYSDFVHSYCWTLGTFIIPSTETDSRSDVGVGLGTNLVERLTLRYYQWVAIVFLLEAFLFYLPYLLWKIWEGKRLKHLCLGMVPAIVSQDEMKEACSIVAEYLNRNNRIYHRSYVIKYFICESLNLLISAFNILFLDFFLNGFWTRYFNTLSKVSLSNWEIWNQHTSQIFPKLAKCTIYTFGLGGSINNHDALCMLPLNILNEKIFAFLWFWFVLIIILSAGKIIYDLLLIFCLPLRIQLLRIRANDVPYYQICNILAKRSFGDWFILYKMSLNVNSMFFTDLLIHLQNYNSYKHNIFTEL